jgi:hypothetical protein
VLNGAIAVVGSVSSFRPKPPCPREDMGLREEVRVLELVSLRGRAVVLRWRELGR